MYEIPNFSLYFLNEYDEVVRKSDGKIMPLYRRAGKDTQKFFKLKNDRGEFVCVSPSKIKALTKGVKVPEGHVQVPKYPNVYVSKEGSVWSGPTIPFPLGKFLSVNCSDNKYPKVKTTEYGNLAVHQLLALTFLDPDYLDKGLCVMHLDDNKQNYNLLNLRVGTYSENNKAAYETGVNPSKKQ